VRQKENGVSGEDPASGNDHAAGLINPTFTKARLPTQVLTADMIGRQCHCLGFTGSGSTPVLALCRRLVEAGYDPNSSLRVYRGGLLVLVVSHVGPAAEFTIGDNHNGTPKLRRLRDVAGPLLRKSGPALRGIQKRPWDDPGGPPHG
jgi:hypothetical protein